jgi:hypothetical protein
MMTSAYTGWAVQHNPAMLMPGIMLTSPQRIDLQRVLEGLDLELQQHASASGTMMVTRKMLLCNLSFH